MKTNLKCSIHRLTLLVLDLLMAIEEPEKGEFETLAHSIDD